MQAPPSDYQHRYIFGKVAELISIDHEVAGSNPVGRRVFGTSLYQLSNATLNGTLMDTQRYLFY